MKIIESIQIRYFRSIYTLNVNQCKDMTVFTGLNDVGKSNILKALNLFFCQKTDYNNDFDFVKDFNIMRKDQVRKTSVKGEQFISITINFNRGNRMENSLPPFFSVTKKWNMHTKECKQSTNVYRKMQNYANKLGKKYSEYSTKRSLSTFLNKVQYVYIPAVKDENVFRNVLNLLQENLLVSKKHQEDLDAILQNLNNILRINVLELEQDFKKSTGIDNFIGFPEKSLSLMNGLLQVNTYISNGVVDINNRGDGVKAHFIPKVLNYIAKNSPKKLYVWGFEEPENSYEYRRCLQIADEFDKEYSINSQIFITTHSPAFYNDSSRNKEIKRLSYKDNQTNIEEEECNIDEELGYIELYKKFIEDIKSLEQKNNEYNYEISKLKEKISTTKKTLILTEGKTDSKLLRLAIRKLNLNKYNKWEINPIKSGKTSNNQVLLRYLEEISQNSISNNLVIGMFDRDTPLKVRVGNNRNIDIRDERFHKFSNNVFAFSIPVPHNRKETDQISIEHYFTDKEIKTEYKGKRLFLGNEFYCTGNYKGDEDLYCPQKII